MSMRRSGDPLFLRLTVGADKRNEAHATRGCLCDRIANSHQIVDRWGDIGYRHRLAVYCVFSGTHPKDPLRMMARALDGIDRIKQIEKIKGLLAQERRANLVEFQQKYLDIYPAPTRQSYLNGTCGRPKRP